MTSSMPITEQSLLEIGVSKQGHRKRLLNSLDNLIYKENKSTQKMKINPFNCCTASIPNNL